MGWPDLGQEWDGGGAKFFDWLGVENVLNSVISVLLSPENKYFHLLLGTFSLYLAAI